ncbi:MAG: hypothetical protein IJ172_06525 [Ruminococcus sp.]|nr:hypothetical protein [Ruminococcus sp.]
MDILGMWKIAEVNAIDMNFKQTWKTVEELTADENIPPMQKQMAQSVYLFEADGTLKQLMPKELAGGEGEPYDDKYVVGHVCGWKEEDGKLMVEGEDGWEEAPATADGFEVFSFFRIVKV